MTITVNAQQVSNQAASVAWVDTDTPPADGYTIAAIINSAGGLSGSERATVAPDISTFTDQVDDQSISNGDRVTYLVYPFQAYLQPGTIDLGRRGSLLRYFTWGFTPDIAAQLQQVAPVMGVSESYEGTDGSGTFLGEQGFLAPGTDLRYPRESGLNASTTYAFRYKLLLPEAPHWRWVESPAGFMRGFQAGVDLEPERRAWAAFQWRGTDGQTGIVTYGLKDQATDEYLLGAGQKQVATGAGSLQYNPGTPPAAPGQAVYCSVLWPDGSETRTPPFLWDTDYLAATVGPWSAYSAVKWEDLPSG